MKVPSGPQSPAGQLLAGDNLSGILYEREQQSQWLFTQAEPYTMSAKIARVTVDFERAKTQDRHGL
jgi:hypothetical protein